MNVFIAVTSGDRKVFIETADAVLQNSHVLRDSGHKVKVYFNFNDCQISRSRNMCAHMFLNNTDCDKMIFVDWDVGFDHDAMLKLVERDVDVVAGIYPCKMSEPVYPCIVKAGEDKRPIVKDGLVQADMVAVGLGCISRKAFEKIIASGQVKKDHNGFYNFFDIGMVVDNDNQWYGEDIIFCKRWVATGGEMWIEPNINFTHTGLVQYKGNYHEFLLKQPQPI